MKVRSCTAAPSKVDTPVNGLSYEEMISQEGVYGLYTGVHSARIIVLKCANKDCVLYYNTKGVLEPLTEWGKTSRFVKIKGAEVCFEIREPKE